MTSHHSRGSQAAATLSSLRIDDTPRKVIDELEALALHKPSSADYARFAETLPSPIALTRRAKHHADQSVRFIELVQKSNRTAFNDNAMQLFSVARLNVVGSLTVALIPARTAAERHAQREQGHAVLGTLEDGKENELYEVVEIAFGLDEADAAKIASDAIAYAGRKQDAAVRDSGATTHTLEERAALAQYLLSQPDAATLVVQALGHEAMEERLQATLDTDDLGPGEHDRIAAARFGAHLQMIIAIARLRLTHPQVDLDAYPALRDAVAKASPHEQGALILAGEQGKHLANMMAAHPF